MKKWILIFIVLVIPAGAWYLYLNRYRPAQESDLNPGSPGTAVIEFVKNLGTRRLPDGILYGNGQIEGTEIRVAAEVSGKVVESSLTEGRSVKSGELLVRLDDADIKSRIAQAEAGQQALEEGRRSLRASIGTWSHHLKTAETDLARYTRLLETKVVPPQQVDQARDRVREAQGHLDELKAQSGEAEAKIVAAARETEWLKIQHAKTRIVAPLDATILTKSIEVGELATPGRVLCVLIDLSRLELKIYIPESAIGKIRLDDPARVRVDTFPDSFFEAAVTRIDQQAQFTPKDIHMPDERARLVFGVTLALNNPREYLKPGMPADAWVRVDKHTPWPEELVLPP